MPLKHNTSLQSGRYRIIDTLGRGGFGITYLAEQVMAHRKVCIKEYFPADYYRRDISSGVITLASEGFAEMMNRFKTKFIKEAQTIAALDHPNIIHIHDIFEENNTAYYVMEYVEGESLSEVVKRNGVLSESEAIGYIRQTASALEYIHSKQIMHLDVKPGNVMIRQMDGSAILIDFGLSKHYDAVSGEATSTTPVGVSHGFAPIEQYKCGGVSRFSPETDIYSLGATLYYLVTGKIPPEAATLVTEPLNIPERVSSTVRDAISKAMSIAPAQRPHSVNDFLSMLLRVPSKSHSASESTVIGCSDIDATVLDTDVPKSVINGHEYVDLGLSVKWATCNVGANRPEDYGNYYAWGETIPKTSYWQKNCKTLKVERCLFGLLKRYVNNNIGDIKGNRYYDAATANWGKDWRLPTETEFGELRNRNNCAWLWITRNGVNGFEITSKKNGNSIFLPAAGCFHCDDVESPGDSGSYWSSTVNDIGSPCHLYFYQGCSSSVFLDRWLGYTIRPVTK